MPTSPKDHTARRAKVTAEHTEEAKALSAIWKEKTKLTQAVFGETYGIGVQSAVGQFLRGEAPLSLKAARAFSLGLGVPISDFSPRLAAAAGWPFEHVDKEMYDRLSQQAQGVVQAKMQAEIERLLGEDPMHDEGAQGRTGTH